MKRSDTLSWSQLKGGIFIVCALIFFAGGVLLMGEKTKFFVPKGRLSVIMADVAGLKVGAPVWLAGVEVGLVQEVRFADPQHSNDVEMLLLVEEASLKKIGRDSVITVKTRGLMGEKYVDITPSLSIQAVPEKRLYGIRVAKLDDVMQKAGTVFDRLNGIVEKVERGEGSLGRLSRDTQLYDNLAGLTVELRSLASSVNRGEGTLGKLTTSSEPFDRLVALLTRADDTLKDIQSADGTLGKLVHDRTLYDKMVALADKSEKATSELRELSRKLMSPEGTFGRLVVSPEFYNKGLSVIDRADRSVASLEEVVGKLKQGEGTAGRLLMNRELYDRMNRTVDSLDALISDIKANPKRYLKLSIF